MLNGSSLGKQALFWCCAFLVLMALLWTFSPILMPFVAGMAIAYFLDPVADRLERAGLSRLMATSVILAGFLLVITLVLVLVIPILAAQLRDFAVRLPSYVALVQTYADQARSDLLPEWARAQIGGVKDNMSGIITQGVGFAGGLVGQLWSSGKAVVDAASILLITPVVAFYVLLDWDRMVAKVDGWLPRPHLEEVRDIFAEIDRTIAGFVRGQGSVCLILGVFYAVGLSMTGLNFGLLIGFFAGMFSFIPYVGAVSGLLVALGIGVVQFWAEPAWLGAVVAVFVVGQFLEGNFLSPKLVGGSVGLHPVWLMFALFAFGLLFGFVGLMVAVPAAAVVGVLVRYALSKYLDSDIYHGACRKSEQNEPRPA